MGMYDERGLRSLLAAYFDSPRPHDEVVRALHDAEGPACLEALLRAARLRELLFAEGPAAADDEHKALLALMAGGAPIDARVLLCLAAYAYRTDALDEAWERATQAIALPADANTPVVAREANSWLIVIAMRQGRRQDARELIERGLKMATAADDGRALARVYNNLSMVEQDEGDGKAAYAAAEVALLLREGLGDDAETGRSLSRLGELAHNAGEHGLSAIHLHRAAELYRRSGCRRDWALALTNLGAMLTRLQLRDAARSTIEAGIEGARAVDALTVVANGLVHLAELALAEGDHVLADEQARLALDTLEQSGENMYVRVAARTCLAEVGRRVNDFDGAREHLSGPWSKPLSVVLEERVRQALARIELDAGNAGAAVDHVRWLAEAEAPSAELRALLCERMGDTVGEIAALKDHLQEARQSADRWRHQALLVRPAITASFGAPPKEDHAFSVLQGLVHDLRNPLTSVLINLELAQEAIMDKRPEEVRARLAAAHGSSLTIKKSLDRGARSGDPLGETSVQLGAIARQVVNESRAAALRKAISLDCHLREVRTAVPPGVAEMAIRNVLSNAVKYTPLGGTVIVETGVCLHAGAAWAYIDAEDSGPGFAEEDLPLRFEPFKRLSAQPTGGEDSIGIGLALAYRAVVDAGGDVTLLHNTPSGARLRVRLPIYVPGSLEED